ncbi:survival motor neuron protein [Plutella xylostella]|uniref:survival motor neuron protein n=1 Tax=Plutella xylostella TaxID=51655 RepID=UPI0018D04F30|nr:survival motor neuron protein [Plutella xylostella]
MSKGEVLYVKGMNLSNQSVSEYDEEEEDVWDDKKLNEAYDKAVNMANAEIAKRIAMSTNKKQNTVPSREVKLPKVKKSEGPSKSKSSKSNKEATSAWKVGMPCRAIYEGDGTEYEAFLLRIINDKECIVRFLGYENSEIVSLDTLKPSLGKRERAQQIQEALSANDELLEGEDKPKVEQMECDSNRANSASSTDRSHNRKKKSPKKKDNRKQGNLPFPFIPNLSMPLPDMEMDMPFPPPPVTLPGDKPLSERSAVHSMLLSWYMSGYYTGMYHAMTKAKESNRSD